MSNGSVSFWKTTAATAIGLVLALMFLLSFIIALQNARDQAALEGRVAAVERVMEGRAEDRIRFEELKKQLNAD